MSRAKGISVRRDDTRRMEEEAKQMEAKLELLRRTMDAASESTPKGADGGRWRSGAASKPLTKGYVKSVMEAPRPKPKGPTAQRSPSTGLRTPVDSTPRKEAAQEAMPGGTLLGLTSSSGAPQATTGAAANLQAAMQQQNREAAEVEAFLGSLKLDRYVSLFMEHGFDCMDVVKEMQESHMREIGMAAGHILKLRKCLTEMNPPPPEPEPSASQRKVTFGNTEQATIPKPPKATASQGVSSNKLSEGAFDEEESAASFQEALRAWREGGSAAKTATAAAENSASSDPPKAAGSFWSTLGGSEVNLERASTPLRVPSELQSTETAETETQRDPCPGEDKLACYQCYKQFFAQYAVERSSTLPEANGGGTKRLCSEACANQWEASVKAKAEAYEQRQAKLQQMKEMQRALELEKEGRAAPSAPEASA